MDSEGSRDVKDFDRWNDHKKGISLRFSGLGAYPQEREVWICSIGKNIGREQNGGLRDFSRPVLVIKKFNNEMFWVVPLSTKQKQLDFYFNYIDPYGLPATAIVAQMRLVSIRRFQRDVYVLPPLLWEKIISLIHSLLP